MKPNLDPHAFPAAWLGYAASLHGTFAHVRVCDRCPDKAQAVALAARTSLPVRLTVCVPCYQRQLAATLGENQESPALG
jgi:hypothetical protein